MILTRRAQAAAFNASPAWSVTKTQALWDTLTQALTEQELSFPPSMPR